MRYVLVGGIVTAIIWFLVGSLLYMNPVVARWYKEEEKNLAIKKWPSQLKYLKTVFLGILGQSFLAVWVFLIVNPVIGERWWIFGLMLIAVRVFPRWVDMWTQTSYPNKLLAVEFINGAIGSMVTALVLSRLM